MWSFNLLRENFISQKSFTYTQNQAHNSILRMIYSNVHRPMNGLKKQSTYIL